MAWRSGTSRSMALEGVEAHIGDEVRDQVILFMTHRRDDGDGTGEDGPNDRLQIERPKVLG